MNAVSRRATDKYVQKYLQADTWLNVREESQIDTYKINYKILNSFKKYSFHYLSNIGPSCSTLAMSLITCNNILNF